MRFSVIVPLVCLLLGTSSQAFANADTSPLELEEPTSPIIHVDGKPIPIKASLNDESLTLQPIQTPPAEPTSDGTIPTKNLVFMGLIGAGSCILVGGVAAVGGGLAGGAVTAPSDDGLLVGIGIIFGAVVGYTIGCPIGAGVGSGLYGRAKGYNGSIGLGMLGGFAGMLVGGVTAFILPVGGAIFTSALAGTGATAGYYLAHLYRHNNKKVGFLPGGGGRTPLGFTVYF